MAIAFVQAADTVVASGATTKALAFTSANTVGNLIVCVAVWSQVAGITCSVADSKVNSWTALSQATCQAVNNTFVQFFYCLGCKAGANTVTASFSGVGPQYLEVLIAEYSGVTVLDKQAVAQSQAYNATMTSPSVTTTQANELLIGYGAQWSFNAGNWPTFTAGTDYTFRGTATPHDAIGGLEDQIVSSAGPYTATMNLANGSSSYGMGIVTFSNTVAPTTGSRIPNALPTPVVLTDANGNVYSVGGTSGPNAGKPTPIVMTDANGNVYAQSFSLTGVRTGTPIPIIPTDASGNAYAATGSLTGTKLGPPAPVAATDINGNIYLVTDTTTVHVGSAIPVVLTDVNGNVLTFSGTHPLLALL